MASAHAGPNRVGTVSLTLTAPLFLAPCLSTPHQLDSSDAEEIDEPDSADDNPTGELSINQAAKQSRPGSKPSSKPPARPSLNDNHPPDPRRMLSQLPKTRPNATRPAASLPAPTRRVNMAHFQDAIGDYWGDQSHDDDHFFDALPDFR